MMMPPPPPPPVSPKSVLPLSPPRTLTVSLTVIVPLSARISIRPPEPPPPLPVPEKPLPPLPPVAFKIPSIVEIHSERVDPGDRFVYRSPVPNRGRAWAVMDNGAPAHKVDLLVLGDGYTEDELELYHAHVRGVIDALAEVTED